LAREAGALTVGVVTKPFAFEGKQRSRRAEAGIAALTEHVDTLITIPNEKLMQLADDELTFVEAFRKADEVLFQAVKGISDLITLDGIVNVDFADVRTVMNANGRALMGTGCAKGEGRARLAAEQAIRSPLLDDISVHGATGVLINVVGGPDMKMKEIQEAASLVQEQAHEDANIIFGASIDESMGDALKITVIATGFDAAEPEITVESPREARRGIPALRESLAPRTMGSQRIGTELPQSSQVPVMPVRRVGSGVQTAASGNGAQMGLPVRDRISFPSTYGSGGVDPDAEWDVPAFQRRQGGG
jgi:cell division protein FtsZ